MMLHTPASAALWFLPFVLPISLWAAWSDLKYMKIFNATVIALVLVFVLVGPIALGVNETAWRLTHLLIVLVIGFVMSTIGWVGGGDAKFAAAAAPFIAAADSATMLFLFSAVMMAGYITHRLIRRSATLRRLAPDWKSWDETRKFPMGFPLGGALLAYLGLAAAFG